ncbi:MAG: MMPL family transporter [Spongiibacteraceae bacterium]
MMLLLLALGVKFQQGLSIETNILALLPPTEQDPVIEHASEQFNQALAQRHLILVGAKQLPQAIKAADEVVEKLALIKGFSRLDYRFDNKRQQQSLAPYLTYKHQLLSSDTRAGLTSGGADFIHSTLQMMYSPLVPVSSTLLENDPLLLFYRFALGLSQGVENISLLNGVLVAKHQGKQYVMINAVLSGSPFSIQLQSDLVKPLEHALATVRSDHPEVEILSVGVVRYANEAIKSAAKEVTTIGVGSLLGVVILLLWVFRSPLPLLASLLAIGSGFIAAFTVCQWVFGSVHLLTLVFGASLIGISIDYSFHFFADRLGGGSSWTGKIAIRRIFSGISLGVVTSCLGYAGLCFAPFPGMQQMALFSTVGLLAAFITVVSLFPYLAARPAFKQGQSIRLQWADRYATCLSWSPVKVVLLLVLLGGVSLFGMVQLSVNDDIRLLQAASPSLRAEEQRVMTILERDLSNQFLLVEGDTVEQLLQREERLQLRLIELQQRGELERFDAISRQLPSQLRQRNNVALIQQHLLADPALLATYTQTLGLDATVINQFTAHYQTPPQQFLKLEDWLASAAADPWRHLWLGKTERGYASVVALYGGQQQPLFALEQTTDKVTLVDKVTDISNLLGDYRQRVAVLVTGSYLLIYLLLCYRYGFLKAVRVMLPPVLAVLVALGSLGWMGQALNIFHLLALLLVLGIGVDYTLFLEEGIEHRDSTMLAIILSALTTLLSFGLLALSNTPAVHAFGITVLMGISICLLLAPMLCGRVNSAGNKTIACS